MEGYVKEKILTNKAGGVWVEVGGTIKLAKMAKETRMKAETRKRHASALRRPGGNLNRTDRAEHDLRREKTGGD